MPPLSATLAELKIRIRTAIEAVDTFSQKSIDDIMSDCGMLSFNFTIIVLVFSIGLEPGLAHGFFICLQR